MLQILVISVLGLVSQHKGKALEFYQEKMFEQSKMRENQCMITFV